MLKIFLDDTRQPHHKHSTQDWILCTCYADFESVVNSVLDAKQEWIDEVSFDYILGEIKRGDDCFQYLLDVCIKYGLNIPKVYVHSEYPGAKSFFDSIAKRLEHRTGIVVPIQMVF